MTQLRSKDCRKTVQLLDDFASGELSVESNQELLHHLAGCSSCREERDRREEVRALVRSSWNSVAAPSGLEQRVRRDLARQVQRADALRLARWAAGLLLVLAAGLTSWLLVQPTLQATAVDHFYEAVMDHFRCQSPIVSNDAPLPVTFSDPQFQASLARISGAYLASPPHRCRFEGVSFVHYQFRNANGSYFSLIFERRGPRTLLAELDGAETLDDDVVSIGSPVLMGQVQGAWISTFSDERYFVYLVTESEGSRSRERMLSIVKELVPTVERRLARL